MRYSRGVWGKEGEPCLAMLPSHSMPHQEQHEHRGPAEPSPTVFCHCASLTPSPEAAAHIIPISETQKREQKQSCRGCAGTEPSGRLREPTAPPTRAMLVKSLNPLHTGNQPPGSSPAQAHKGERKEGRKDRSDRGNEGGEIRNIIFLFRLLISRLSGAHL